MSGVFHIKEGNLLPVLEAALFNPDGTVYDLTGNTGVKLKIKLADGTRLWRTMTVFGLATAGIIRYTFIASDWAAASGTPDANGAFPVGGLVPGPALPIRLTEVEHRMEYEVSRAGVPSLTFPNDGYDTLRILADLGTL